IGDATREHRHDGGCTAFERFGDACNLAERAQRRYVDLHTTFDRKTANQWQRRLTPRVGDWDLYENVFAPTRNESRLAVHFRKVVGKHLERDGPVFDVSQYVFGEGRIVADAALAHERRVGGET